MRNLASQQRRRYKTLDGLRGGKQGGSGKPGQRPRKA